MTVTLELPEVLIDALVERVRDRVDVAPRHVSKRVLADRLGVEERTIRTWRSKGLPGTRVGREVMYEIAAVDRWIEQQA